MVSIDPCLQCVSLVQAGRETWRMDVVDSVPAGTLRPDYHRPI